MRRIIKFLTSRLLLVVPLVVLQFALFILMFLQVMYVGQIVTVVYIMGYALVVYIVNQNEEPAYIIAWCVVILALPGIGVPLYILAGNRKVPSRLRNGTIRVTKAMDGLLEEDLSEEEIKEIVDPSSNAILQYQLGTNGFPAYANTESTYYPNGEEWIKDYLEELKKAKHFIFLEFFIIVEGSVWDDVLEILKEKAAEGVTVKIIYDDFGSIPFPAGYPKELAKYGIEAYRFNHVRPAFIIQMNNRDHRKITVIDNNVAFTGGVNLADEYANRIERFGYWKDSAVKLHGEAVWSFTVMFLGMFSYCRYKETGEEQDFRKYHLTPDQVDDGGLYQPFSDTPTDSESVALNTHLMLVTHAKKYIYIDTPYLIPTYAMKQALTVAAKSGVDVRILTPHIPDKKLVFQITRGNYSSLLKAGVKIYEYTPGFNHCKNVVSDDEVAVVGSINMDYRSYFLHFENGVLLYHTKEVMKIKQGFLDSLEKSHEVTLEEAQRRPLIVTIIRAFLNLFIPLL